MIRRQVETVRVSMAVPAEPSPPPPVYRSPTPPQQQGRPLLAPDQRRYSPTPHEVLSRDPLTFLSSAFGAKRPTAQAVPFLTRSSVASDLLRLARACPPIAPAHSSGFQAAELQTAVNRSDERFKAGALITSPPPHQTCSSSPACNTVRGHERLT